MATPKQSKHSYSHSFDKRLRKQSIELHDEAMSLFEDIKSKNRIKIIKFLHNLVDCGNKTESAFSAGIGVSEDKEKPLEKQKAVAAAEAHRLLRNPTIKKAYDALQRSREMDLFAAQSFTREKSIAMLAQIAVTASTEAPAAARGSIVDAARLSGFYEEDMKKELDKRIEAIAVRLPNMPNKNAEEKQRLIDMGLISEDATLAPEDK